MNIVAKIIELIYYSHNSKLILPNHFLENLLSYCFTNCKTYTNFVGARGPGGSYSYVAKWLNSQANEPIKFPDGFVKAIFDNNQKIGRTYLITGMNQVPTSIMTSHLWITLDESNTIQNESVYKPESWMWNAKGTLEKENITKLLTTSSEALKQSRDSLIASCIRKVKSQLGTSGTDCIDHAVESQLRAETQIRLFGFVGIVAGN